MLIEWQIQEAKAKFSRVVDEAMAAPQLITRRGEPVVMMISVDEYKRLTAKKQTFVEALLSAPFPLDELDLTRDQTPVPPALDFSE